VDQDRFWELVEAAGAVAGGDCQAQAIQLAAMLEQLPAEEILAFERHRPKRRYQRTASTITSGGKRKPAKADRTAGAGRDRVRIPAVSPLSRGHEECNRARAIDLGDPSAAKNEVSLL
jgi:Protein of unknown function (DUF4240)